MTERFLDGRVTLHRGDCIEVLRAMPENSVDAVVTDPPYHLTSIVNRFGAEGAAPAKSAQSGVYARASTGFMGKTWDGGDIAFRVETWAEVLRVLKPGGYILAFASTRGFGRMSVAIEDAGFNTHPMIGWLFGSGFPKATRIKAEGFGGQRYGGQSLKPALEPIYMGQKPFSEDTGTANILRWGTGAVNIDACRVGSDERTYSPKGTTSNASMIRVAEDRVGKAGAEVTVEGRWPANLIHDGSEAVVSAFPGSLGQQGDLNETGRDRPTNNAFGDMAPPLAHKARGDAGSAARFFKQCSFKDGEWHSRSDRDASSAELPSASCATPIAADPAETKTSGSRRQASTPTQASIDGSISSIPTHSPALADQMESIGTTPITPSYMRSSGSALHATDENTSSANEAKAGDASDPASATPFRYSAKADADDRIGSKHPTVKPLDLMQYLVRLVTPKGGTVLDPFAGTGTTGEAAWREGLSAVLIEREPAYAADIARRMELAIAGPDERKRKIAKAGSGPADHGPLFGAPV